MKKPPKVIYAIVEGDGSVHSASDVKHRAVENIRDLESEHAPYAVHRYVLSAPEPKGKQ